MCASTESTHDALPSMRTGVRAWDQVGGRFGAVLPGAVILSMVVHLGVKAFRSAAPWTNNDTAFLVYVGQQMQAGARLYVDWHDTDPPSIFFIAASAVRLGRLIHVPALFAYDLITVGIAIAGLCVLVHSLDALGRPASARVLAASAYTLFLMKAGPITRDFGQREHLFALVLIPELFASASPGRFPWRPAWCGVAAFLAMMKPQFVAILAVLELTAPRTLRFRRPDLAGFAVGAVAPLGMLWWHSSEAFSALFTDAIAVHLSGAYALLNQSPSLLLGRGPLLVAAVSLAASALMLIVRRRDNSLSPLVIRGVLGLACCALVILQQRKYFPYHFVPLFGMSVVCGAWAVGEYLADRHQRFAIALAALALCAGLTVFHADVSGHSGDAIPVRLAGVTHDDPSLLVESVYMHGLCSTYRGAPRCVGPDANTVTLPQMAWAPDSTERLRTWASMVAAHVRDRRPDLIALSTGSLAMPDGLSPAELLLERFPIFANGEYVRFSADTDDYVDARNFLILRRRDVPERVPPR
jgi:hypothetical protein